MATFVPEAGVSTGREVAVVGRLHLDEWTSREGERRSRLQVVAGVQFLDPPKKQVRGGGAAVVELDAAAMSTVAVRVGSHPFWPTAVATLEVSAS
jgi:single-stranded DNA-binding protein